RRSSSSRTKSDSGSCPRRRSADASAISRGSSVNASPRSATKSSSSSPAFRSRSRIRRPAACTGARHRSVAVLGEVDEGLLQRLARMPFARTIGRVVVAEQDLEGMTGLLLFGRGEADVFRDDLAVVGEQRQHALDALAHAVLLLLVLVL